MDAALLRAISAAAEASPQGNGDVGTHPGRLLLADGDGLAYYCAGNDDTHPGVARANLIDKLKSAMAACGAESCKIVTTARGSHKGFRYAVARVKPYQGGRTDDRRPKNWAFLRDCLEAGDFPHPIEVEFTTVAEADDLFSRYAKHHPDCVIYTQDKDMRMVPGWHLDWLTHLMFKLEEGVWSAMNNDKQYGRVWFWCQMLHGDAVDNIPGLPFYTDGSVLKSGPKKGQVKEIRCGEKSPAVVDMLPTVSSDMGATLLLQKLYQSCYGDRWLVEMLEQGILLWMRNDAQSSALNVVEKGNPLYHLTTHEAYPAARAEVMLRIAESQVFEETENDGSLDDTSGPACEASLPLCAVQDGAGPERDGAGSQPLDRDHPSDAAPILQRPAGEDREQPQAVRSAAPSRVPQWGLRLLAAA